MDTPQTAVRPDERKARLYKRAAVLAGAGAGLAVVGLFVLMFFYLAGNFGNPDDPGVIREINLVAAAIAGVGVLMLCGMALLGIRYIRAKYGIGPGGHTGPPPGEA